MEFTLAEEFAHIYPTCVRLVGVKVRNRGEVKKLDSAGVSLRTGDPVLIEVEGEITKGLACNCSICQRKGSLLWFVPRNSLALSTPEENSRVYMFNKHLLKHRFCPTCGIHPYAEGKDPKGNEMAAVNIRCLEGIDLSAIPVTHFDGRSM